MSKQANRHVEEESKRELFEVDANDHTGNSKFSQSDKTAEPTRMSHEQIVQGISENWSKIQRQARAMTQSNHIMHYDKG